MLEHIFITHCAPTIGGVKMGNMISVRRENLRFYEDISKWNEKLSDHDLRIFELRNSGKSSLLYLYHPKQLEQRLQDHRIGEFLSRFGYVSNTSKDTLMYLQKRFQDNFPHEVGVFLDYPPDDVASFIRYRGKHYLFRGCWKVYHHPMQARETFRIYKNCTRQCVKMYHSGIHLCEILKLIKEYKDEKISNCVLVRNRKYGGNGKCHRGRI